jgi:hypothetical protein
MDSDSNNTDPKPEPMATLAGVGDRELWYAEGQPDEKGEVQWRFPLYVDWKMATDTGIEYAMIFTAICPHYKASFVLKALFEAHDKLSSLERQNQWLVRKEVVPALLKKAAGITKERYYRWDGKESKAPELPGQRIPFGAEDGSKQPNHLKSGAHDRLLIQQIAEECGLQSSVVKIVIDGLNKVAADFMVSQHRVMDLGFIKLIAVPFRANWKEIVCFKLRKLGLLKHLKEDGYATTDSAHDSTAGLPETLCSPHNVAIRREQKTKKGFRTLSRVDYSIEVLTSKHFEKEVSRLETKHRSCGNTAYVSYYEKAVERLYENILEILRAYRKKIGLPFARIHQSSRTGGLHFIETVGIKARAHGRNLRDLPVHIVPPTHGFSARAEESEPLLVHSPAVEVPKVSTLSQGVNDVREREEPRSLEEFLDRDRGAGGLPLLDAGEGEAARESMLPCSTAGGESSGVDEKRD